MVVIFKLLLPKKSTDKCQVNKEINKFNSDKIPFKEAYQKGLFAFSKNKNKEFLKT